MLNIGQIVSYPVLMEKLHDHTAGHVYNGTIRCNIKHVRKALRQADWPFVVKSIYGLGYRLEAETEDIAKGIRKGYSLATNVVC